jgi:hypothetical protein
MFKIGKYTVIYHQKENKIMVEKKENGVIKKIMIRRTVYQIILIHERAEMITFSHYKVRGRWSYKDSREQTSCNRRHVVSEINRLLKVENGEEIVSNWFGRP